MTQDVGVVRLIVDRSNPEKIKGKVWDTRNKKTLRVLTSRKKSATEVLEALDSFCDKNGFVFRQYECPPAR